MNKLKTIVLLAVVSCLPGAAGAMDMNMAKSSSDNLMWLAPMSWDDLRAQRDKAKKMNEASGKPMEGMKSMEGMGKSGTDRKQRAKDDNNNKKKRSEASASMRRMYYIRSGAFPEVPKSQNPMAKPMAKQDVMSHDGMKMQGADMGQMSMDKGMDNTILWVKFPDNSVQNFKARQRGPALLASFPSGDGGWHTLFAYNDMGVKDGSRVHLLSHLTYFSHGEHADEKDAPTVEGPGYYQGRPVLELERLCANHRECYRTVTGKNLRVQASFKGQPLANTMLTMTTEKGWRQTKRTDAHGKASFVIIKEDFPEKADRRKSEDYLVTLEHTTNQMGMLNGEHYHGERYIATLPLRVFPSPLDWESRSVSFLVLAGVIIVAGGAIAIRRKRRRLKA